MPPPSTTNRAHFILFVSDQERSTRFYTEVLASSPRLHVPGMTEFDLPGGAVLGLMPESGIERLLGDAIPGPSTGPRTSRCELYLIVSDPAATHARALAAGGRELSPLQPRNWGDIAAYASDPDGHIVASAGRLETCAP